MRFYLFFAMFALVEAKSGITNKMDIKMAHIKSLKKDITAKDIGEILFAMTNEAEIQKMTKEEQARLLSFALQLKLLQLKSKPINFKNSPDYKEDLKRFNAKWELDALMKDAINKIDKKDLEIEYANIVELQKKTFSHQCRVIEVKNIDDAENILTSLKHGNNFGELAKKHSIHPNKEAMIDYNESEKLPIEVQQALNNLQEGQFSKVIKTKSSYFIALCANKKAAKIPSFKDLEKYLQSAVYMKNLTKNMADDIASGELILFDQNGKAQLPNKN